MNFSKRIIGIFGHEPELLKGQSRRVGLRDLLGLARDGRLVVDAIDRALKKMSQSLN